MEKLAEITLPGGATTIVHVAESEDADSPVVLVLPAMGVPAGYYGPFVDDLATHGVTAAVADYPGQGESRPAVDRAHDHGYTELAHEWLPRVIKTLRREHTGPLITLGHSLGGHILLAHLAGDEPLPDAVVLIGAGSPYWRAVQGMRTLAQTQFMALVARLCGVWPGDRLGFGGVQARTLIREWAAFARTDRLSPGGTSVAAPLRHRSLDVLVVDLDGDHLAPAAAVDALVAKLPSAQVERFTFTKGPDDPGRPVSHTSFARSPELIGERIATWVLNQTDSMAN